MTPAISASNQLADHATRAFLSAFREICTAHAAEGNLAWAGAGGEFEYSGDVDMLVTEDGRLRPGSDLPPLERPDVFVQQLMIDCTLHVRLDSTGKAVAVPRGLLFWYVPNGLLDGSETPTWQVYVTAEADPWLDHTFLVADERDNRAIAQLNRPLLERALREWECGMGSPISEWDSSPYRDYICRYGFRGEDEPCPE